MIQPLSLTPSDNWLASQPLTNEDRLTVLRRTPLRVVSWSMFPTIHKGDLLDVCAPNHLETGDIIVYLQNSDLICHRVKALPADGSLLTAGDANNGSGERVQRSQVLGKVVEIIRGDRRLSPSVTIRPSPFAILRCVVDHWKGCSWDRLRRWLRNVACWLRWHPALQRGLLILLRRWFTAHLTMSGSIGTLPAVRTLLVTGFPVRETDLQHVRRLLRPDQYPTVQVRLHHRVLGSLNMRTGERTLHPLAEGLGIDIYFNQLLRLWRLPY
jgi:hypothetical protein